MNAVDILVISFGIGFVLASERFKRGVARLRARQVDRHVDRHVDRRRR